MSISPLKSRGAGVLLHPTSLPDYASLGAMGSNAYKFVDFLKQCGFKYWQILPSGPTHADGSPYNSLSAFAGNLQWLGEQRVEKQSLENHTQDSFENNTSLAEFRAQQHYWLEDYALFTAIKHQQDGKHWIEWPEALRSRRTEAIASFKEEHQSAIASIIQDQFQFSKQWSLLKQYAAANKIKIIGDLPIFVAHDSADVWSHQSLFKLDSLGHPTVVAGVPPDYFSKTGQRWGNPLYQWEALQAQHYDWWNKRLDHSLQQFDWVRIDHFRGFDACWEIPAQEETAIKGEWVTTPGIHFFEQLTKRLDSLPLIAEDLGIITPSVEQLRDNLKLPGMRILQFAHDSDGKNPYLPHNHIPNSVVYTGTHDNDTTLGWYLALNQEQKRRVLNYYAWPQESIPWPIIKSALSSVAKLAIIPMQDLLALDGKHRMNTPGTTQGNWSWQFTWDQISSELPAYIASLNKMYNR